ncbi:hypothetical protein [Agrobacterium rosae]|uniref:Sulfotransferase family protein n=1 Tax=Agrobacterium rosae TaxID=1972867 RepID=A0AAW9FR66_9HYPH|nr:hypothetical protein [Agrobacterium rosae]MDX8305924.1 hypothetical protein [Agrobacterium rosae]
MIFIHTPKCGGSYVSQAFGKRFKQCPTLQWREARGHKTFLEYRDIFRARQKSLEQHVLFTVVRNPWEWHLSWFNYVSKDTDAKKSGMPLEHLQIKDMSFSEYLVWLDDPSFPRSENDYTRRQVSDWIVDETGKVGVHEVLRQETLQDDLVALRDKYSLKIKIPLGEMINASRPAGDYRPFYNDKQADFIARRHRRDIDLLGYQF